MILILFVAAASWYSASGGSGNAQPFDLSQATYVGAQSCVTCHAKEAALYKGSHHDCAMAPATSETVLGDFSGQTLEHLGVTSRMFRDGEKFMINTEGPNGVMQDFEVKYVFGITPLQQYIVEFDNSDSSGQASPASKSEDGRFQVAKMQVLRVSWDTEKKIWFHLDPPDVSDRLSPDDDLHWTGMGQRWNSMCGECHTTNYEKGFDTKSLRYHTKYSETNVSCEACHGPGSKHIELAKKWMPGWNRQRGYGLANLKASAENQIQACAPCHSRRDVIADGFRAGDNFYDYYSNQLLTEPTYYADGQILDEDFDHGSFIQSKMYHKGIRCTDCHDPHTARLKHDGNAVCTSCHQHPTAKYDSVGHHFHKPGTAGAQCVNCHMPSTTYMAVDARRDHSLRIPRPDLSLSIQTPNACTGCHLKPENVSAEKRDKLVLYQDWMQKARAGDAEVKAELARADQWCNEACDKWYGEKRRRDEHFGIALAAAQRRAPNAVELLTKLLKKSGPEAPAIARATALELLSGLDPIAGAEAAVNAFDDDNPLVRTAAVEAVLGHPTQTVAAEHLSKALKDSRRSVRSHAGRALVQIPPQRWPQSAGPRLHAVMEEVVSGLTASNDRAGAHLTLGSLAEQEGRLEAAIKHYRDATAVEPGVAGPRSNLAALLENQAMQAAEQKIPVSPQLEEEISQLRKAELKLLERDAKLLPDAPSILYRWGLALVLDKQMEAALQPIQRAAELDSGNYQYVQGITLLLKELKRYPEATNWARKLQQLAPDDPGVAAILAELQQASAQP